MIAQSVSPPRTYDDDDGPAPLVAQLCAAWDRGDADAFARVFTEDASYVVFDGTLLQGRAAIADAHRPLFSGWLAGSRLRASDLRTRVVAPGIVAAVGRGAVLPRGSDRVARSRRSIQTYLFVHRDRWEIAAFTNTRDRPFAQTLFGRIVLRLQAWFGRGTAEPSP